MKEQYIEVEKNVELFYQEKGSGQPLIFIPGLTFSTKCFEHQIDYFSKTHRVIVIDPRSQGNSSKVLSGNDYITHSQDLNILIQKLDLKNIILIGWSFGCLTSWGYVKIAGTENIKALVSIDLSPQPLSQEDDAWVEGKIDEIGVIYNSFWTTRQGHRDFIIDYLKEVMVQRTLKEKEVFDIVGDSLKTPTTIGAALFASGMFSNCMEEARRVDEKIPALNVIAEHWSETAIRFTKKHFPNTKTATLGGHLMFWEYPEKFNRIVSDFLKNI